MSKAGLVLKTGIAITLLALVLFAASTYWTVMNLKKTITQGFNREVDTVMSLIPDIFAGPLFDYNYDEITRLSERIFSKEIIVGLRVSDGEQNIAELSNPDADPSALVHMEQNVLGANALGEEITLGVVSVDFSTKLIQDDIVTSMRNSILQSVLIVLVIIGFNALVLSIMAVRPIKLASLKMREIAEGEADLTNRLVTRSGDEVGQLSRHFNAFLGNLDSLVMDIRRSLADTMAVQTELGANSEETAAALTQMSASIESARRQMEILSGAVAKSKGAVHRIGEQIDRTIRNVEGQGAMVEETTAAVTELLASIDNVAKITQREKEATDKLVQTAHEGGEQLRNTTGVIGDIEQSIDKIHDFLSIINNIAAQTNLLAMNAAIEAAHAGDAGRGFAVVAGEIRNLAEGTGENAKSIAGVLGQIIGGIQNAAKLSQQTMTAFSEIDREVNLAASSLDEISSAMGEMSIGSREIHKAVGELNTVSQELVKDAREMKEGSLAVSEVNGEISNVSGVVDTAMEEISRGVHEISEAMNKITEINVNLGENSSELNGKMARFKTSDSQEQV